MLQVVGGNLANLLPNIATNISVLGAIINQFSCALLTICYCLTMLLPTLVLQLCRIWMVQGFTVTAAAHLSACALLVHAMTADTRTSAALHSNLTNHDGDFASALNPAAEAEAAAARTAAKTCPVLICKVKGLHAIVT